VTEDYTFDPQTGLLTNQKATKNGSLFINLSYNYARNNSVGTLNGKTGHLTKITDNLNTQKNREYEFDAVGRLTLAKGGPTGTLWTQTYTYDRWGNRLTVAKTGTAAGGGAMPLDGIAGLTYDNASNRLNKTIGAHQFQYDVNGNQTKTLAEDGTTWVRYEYDSANRLWLVKRDSDGVMLQRFGYGSTNARFQALDNATGQWTLYAANGGTVLSEYTELTANVPTWTKSYTYLGDRLLSTTTPNGSGGEITDYNHPDRLGTKVITNQAAGTSSEQATLPFGTALNAETSPPLTTNNKRFTSYDRSPKTGLDYAVNRTYDSKQGRFTQVDPIGMQAVDLNMPQTLNLYSYCANDPINRTDPDGLSWFSSIFRFIKKIGNIIANILKIAVFVAMVVISIATFGTVLGIIVAIGFTVVPHLIGIVAKTIWRNIKESIRRDGLSFGSFFRGLWRGIKQAFSFIKAVFSRGLEGLVPVYGYFCAPGWGIDGPTNGQEPYDELDSACKEHDFRYREIDDLYESGQISKKERKRLRTKADLRFMKKVITSSNRATGGYLVVLEFLFLLKVIFKF
jgi:RHS repeat-associated protein